MRVRARVLTAVVAAVVIGVGAAPATAGASELVGSNVHSIGLIVNSRGIARVTYTTSSGTVVHLLAWGAVNALPPSRTVPQVRFSLNFAGGYGSPFGSGYWRIMHNYCRPYTGPALINLVAACRATDGSYWALQTWMRLAANGGWDNHAAVELYLSHWTGPLPRITLYQNWEPSDHAIDRVFGEFTYAGSGVYGFTSTPSGAPTDSYGRNLYVDVHDVLWRSSGWNIGNDWYRFNSGLAHQISAGQLLPNGQPAEGGGFCLGMWPLYRRMLAADGNAYRVTASGPGVTPVVRGGPLTAAPTYSATRQSQLISLERTFTPTTDSCFSGGS